MAQLSTRLLVYVWVSLELYLDLLAFYFCFLIVNWCIVAYFTNRLGLLIFGVLFVWFTIDCYYGLSLGLTFLDCLSFRLSFVIHVDFNLVWTDDLVSVSCLISVHIICMVLLYRLWLLDKFYLLSLWLWFLLPLAFYVSKGQRSISSLQLLIRSFFV